MVENLIPCRGKHAVKEASLTVFVDGQITDYQAYRGELEHSLNGKFQRFEIVNAQDVTINFKDGAQNVQKTESQPVGFKFLAYDQGKLIRVFQGINEKHRNYFTFHELNYVRWKQFSELFESCISAISQLSKYKVKAYSLHFIDEFDWNSTEQIPYDRVFKIDNPIVPKIFFDSNSVDFLMSRNIREKGVYGENFIERTQINGIYTGKEKGSKIVISHNLTDTIGGDENVYDLITSPNFREKVDNVHKLNKELLSLLLMEAIQKKINLNG